MLIPLEQKVLERDAVGQGAYLSHEERDRIDARARDMGLWGLDAPEDVGGADLPAVAMIGVNIEMGKTCVPYYLPPDSPNLRMLMATVNEDQRERYLAPYVQRGTVSAIGISEPGAGADPAAMTTRAVKEGNEWVINGRKIWISRAADADFTILMAVTDKAKGARGGICAFLVDKGTPGFNVLRRIPMIGGQFTYEVALENCRVPACEPARDRGRGLCADADPAVDAAAADGVVVDRHGAARARHDAGVCAAARDVRRAAVEPAGDPVVDRRRRHEDPGGEADDLRDGVEARPEGATCAPRSRWSRPTPPRWPTKCSTTPCRRSAPWA